MKVLVTGGAGFIASHITDALITEEHQVSIVDNLSTGFQTNLNPDANFYQFDISDTPSLKQVFRQERPEIVSHHAAQIDVRRSVTDPGFDAQVNLIGTLNIMSMCVKFNVRKVIFASTSAVYPEPQYLPVDEIHPILPDSPYGLSKYAVEHYLRLYYQNYGIEYTIFRYGNVYGPRQDPHGECGVVAIFSEQMLSGIQPTIFGDGSKTRDYIYIDDVVRANLLVLDNLGSGEVFNIGWGEEVMDDEIFDAVRKAVGASIEPRYDKKRPGELDRISLDSSKARRILDWSPSIRLEEGIPITVRYYCQRHQQTQR